MTGGPISIDARAMQAILRGDKAVAPAPAASGPIAIDAGDFQRLLRGGHAKAVRGPIAVDASDLPIVLGGDTVEAAWISDDVIRLVVPLTPSFNKIAGWQIANDFGKLAQWKRDGLEGVRHSVSQLWGGGGVTPRPWADRIELGFIRCTETFCTFDDDNAINGVKYARDALVKVGIVVDDNMRHVRVSPEPVETRTRRNWDELEGPATHLLIRKTA